MKVIELLNKIANGEELPKKVKYKDKEYICYDCHYDLTKYETLPTQYEYSKDFILDNMHLNLNDEIEIIEEKNKYDELMPKHLTNEFIQRLDKYMTQSDIKCMAHKINEIINYLQHINKGDSNE